MSESLRPARTVSPGRIISRELEARGWTQQDLAAIMSRPEQAISEIVQAKKQITAETALQLAHVFGTSAEFWLNLEMLYQLNKAPEPGEADEISRRSNLYSLAPITEMTRRGWIQPKKTIAEQEQEYCSYFNVPSVNQIPSLALNARILDVGEPQKRAILAWIRRVEQLAEAQPVAAFEISSVAPLVDRLLALAGSENAVGKIPGLLLDGGIHFIYVPHMPKTTLDGAMFWVNEHPVVALTLRYDRIDAFWFTLLHELAHIYLCHTQAHVDQLFDRTEVELDRQELEANRQASEWLVPEDEFKKFIENNRPRYSRKKIEEFAAEHSRHPGIIVGQLMFCKELKYSQLRDTLVKVKNILLNWQDVFQPN